MTTPYRIGRIFGLCLCHTRLYADSSGILHDFICMIYWIWCHIPMVLISILFALCPYVFSNAHWHPNFVMILTLSSLGLRRSLSETTTNATSGDKFGIMTTLVFSINLKHLCEINATVPRRTNTTDIILCMRPANERWHYSVTLSLTGWAHTQNDPYTVI